MVLWVMMQHSQSRTSCAVWHVLQCVNRAEDYWWKGQNQRTFCIGKFPRCITNARRPLANQDISKPLDHSFIHTGKRERERERIPLSIQYIHIKEAGRRALWQVLEECSIHYSCLTHEWRIQYMITFDLVLPGHGGIRGKTWGSPAFIDPMYLGNPMQPQDKMGSVTSRRDSEWLVKYSCPLLLGSYSQTYLCLTSTVSFSAHCLVCRLIEQLCICISQ